MEVSKHSSDMAVVVMGYPTMAETLLAAHRSIVCLLMLVGSLLDDRSDFTCVKDRFPLDELHKVEKPTTKNKDASDSENDDEDDDDTAEQDDDDDDAGDEDCSGEEGGDDDDDEEVDPSPRTLQPMVMVEVMMTKKMMMKKGRRMRMVRRTRKKQRKMRTNHQRRKENKLLIGIEMCSRLEILTCLFPHYRILTSLG